MNTRQKTTESKLIKDNFSKIDNILANSQSIQLKNANNKKISKDIKNDPTEIFEDSGSKTPKEPDNTNIMIDNNNNNTSNIEPAKSKNVISHHYFRHIIFFKANNPSESKGFSTYQSSDSFKDKLQALTQQKDIKDSKNSRNFKCGRGTILMNLSSQNIINALEKLLPQHPEDESQTENQNFIFTDPDFQEIDIKIEGHDNVIEWVSIHDIASTGTGTEQALFIDQENLENNKFLEKSVIEGVNDLEFLKYIANIIH